MQTVQEVDEIAKYNGACIYANLATRTIYMDAEDVKYLTRFNPSVVVPRAGIPLYCAQLDKYMAGFTVDTLVASNGSVSSLGLLCKQFGTHAMQHMHGIYITEVMRTKGSIYAYGCHTGEKSVTKILEAISAWPELNTRGTTIILAGNHSDAAVEGLVRKNVARSTAITIAGLSSGIINFTTVDPRISDIFAV